MSDIAPDVSAAPAADSTAPAAAPAAAPSAVSPTADIFDNAEVQQFSREYVQKLREEAAGKRTALKQYEVFEQYSDQERQAWAQLATLYRTNPQQAAAEFAKVAQALQDAGHTTEQTKEVAKQGGQAQYLTQEQLNQVLADRDRQTAIQQESDRILSQAKTLGYEPNTAQQHELLWRAANQHSGDLQAAHAAIQADRQSIIDGYLKDKAGQGGAQVTTNTGESAATSKPIQTFADARASLEARLAQSR